MEISLKIRKFLQNIENLMEISLKIRKLWTFLEMLIWMYTNERGDVDVIASLHILYMKYWKF